MGSGYSADAVNALKKYIDSNSQHGNEFLKTQLFLATKEGRYKLLMDVRGDKNIGMTRSFSGEMI